MFKIFYTITCKVSTKTPIPFVTIFVLALLSGCAAVNTVQTAPLTAEKNVCTSATDTFCLEGDKDQGARFNRQGLEYAAKKEYEKSIEMFKQAIEVDNSNPEYHYNLGVGYDFMGNEEASESAYMDVLMIEPNDPESNSALRSAYFNLACLYARQGKKDMALVQLEKLFSIDPGSLYHTMQTDEDLKSLRDDPRYKQLITKNPGNSGKHGEASKPEETSKPQEISKAQELGKSPEKPAKSRKSGKSKKKGKSQSNKAAKSETQIK